MASLTDELQPLLQQFTTQLEAAANEQAVRKVYADFGGANGAIRLKQKELLKSAPNEHKRVIGQATNEILQKVDGAFEAALKRLGDAAAARDLERSVDVTLFSQRNVAVHGEGWSRNERSLRVLLDEARHCPADAYVDLIRQSAQPLKAIEEDFAVDSSGFRTRGFVRWFNARYGKEQVNHDWLKLHLICGVKTNIVVSVETSDGHANDSPFFKLLVNAAMKGGFNLKEVSADKAYSSRPNLRLVEKHGGTPYIVFKDNARGDSKCETWNRMFHYYSLHPIAAWGQLFQR